MLGDIRMLASAGDVDSFMLCYSKLLDSHPDCPVSHTWESLACNKIGTWNKFELGVFGVLGFGHAQPLVVEKIVSLREGIPRKEAKDVRDTIRDAIVNAMKGSHKGCINECHRGWHDHLTSPCLHQCLHHPVFN